MKIGSPTPLQGDRDCINEERVNAMALAACVKIIRVGWVGNSLIPHACGLRWNDQPEGDGAHKYRLLLRLPVNSTRHL